MEFRGEEVKDLPPYTLPTLAAQREIKSVPTSQKKSLRNRRSGAALTAGQVGTSPREPTSVNSAPFSLVLIKNKD